MLPIMPKDFARGYEFMGSCYFYANNADSAKAYALKAVEMDDYSVEAHGLLSDLYLAEGNRAAARKHTRAILRHNPELMYPPSD
jgi:tetratricopeptide (TPR) repeat protein